MLPLCRPQPELVSEWSPSVHINKTNYFHFSKLPMSGVSCPPGYLSSPGFSQLHGIVSILSICLAHCSWEESEQAKCTRLQGSHTLLEYSVLCSLPTLKPLSQDDNGCLTGIHMYCLRAPFCLHANVNGYLLVCMLTPPAQCPMSTAVCKRPPHAVGRAAPTNPVSTHARATSKTFALGPT